MDIKLPDLSKQIATIGKVAAIVTVVGAVVGAYAFYRNNIWRPKITVINVDWDKQIADVIVGGKTKRLYPNSILSVGGKWGIQFGFANNIAERIELVQNRLVYDVLATNKTIA